jgi:hypothetical protein
VVEWDVEVISRLLFLLTWEGSARELKKRPAEWKGFLRAAVNLTMPSQGFTRNPEPHWHVGEALLAHGVLVCCSLSCCRSRSAGVQ